MKDIKLTTSDAKYKNNLKFKKKMQFDTYIYIIKKAFPSFDPGRLDL